MIYAATQISERVTSEAEATQLLARLRRLPAFNATAARMLAQPFDDEASIADLEMSFGSDPSLASQLLVAANSPALGFRSRISTIRHALAVLGFDRIRALVASIATSAYMRGFRQEWVRPIWTHAVATGVIAEHLAKYSDTVSGASMYTAGLTHDLGRLGLLACEKESYKAFLFDEFRTREESNRREEEVFGVTHTEAGAILTHLWGFPLSLCDHARNHHEPAGSEREEDHIVQSACMLADAMGYPEVTIKSSSPRTLEKWQNKCLGDSCRDAVETRIQEFLS